MTPPRKATRKDGKRNDPNYQQLTAYVRQATWQQVKIALVPENREISDLVQELLETWLQHGQPASAESRRREDLIQQALRAIEQTFAARRSVRERTALTARLAVQVALRVLAGIEPRAARPRPSARRRPSPRR